MFNKDTKKNILFANDTSLPCAAFTRDRPPAFLRFLREAWEKIEPLDHNGRVAYLRERDIPPVLGYRPASKVLPDEVEPIKRSKRSAYKFVNKWVGSQYQPK